MPKGSKPSTQGWTAFMIDPWKQLSFLTHEWRLMMRPQSILPDFLASIAVALVALPLSLAISNASGVRPEIGLVTAVVGGIAVALLGGSRLQVSGPAAAMTFLVLEIVNQYGMEGVIACTLIAGVLQVISGIFRLGRFMQFIPRPVIAGFLSGIGLTILCTQTPVILGYDVLRSNEEGGALALFWKTVERIDQTDFPTLAVGLSAVLLMRGLPRISRRLPAPLIAVTIASLVPWLQGWSTVTLLGDIPSSFPLPRFPEIPWGKWNELIMASFTVFFLASIESLLSASVVESMSRAGQSVDNDQELIGQGVGNMASAFFGGIPVTGVIARSATNIEAGAQTRLSAILHALIILAMMLLLSPLAAQIPRAALAGVLFAVALRMIELDVLRALWRSSRVEAIVFLVTAGTIIVTDLINGVQVGLLATVFYFVYEMSNLDIEEVRLAPPDAASYTSSSEHCPMVQVIRVEGPLFFASAFHIRNLVSRIPKTDCVILDLEQVSFLDVTGAEHLERGVAYLREQGVTVILARPTEVVRRRLLNLDSHEFRNLRECPVYREFRDAELHASSLVETRELCSACKEKGVCAALQHLVASHGPQLGTAVPRVRAVMQPNGNAGWSVSDTVSGQGTTSTPSGLQPATGVRLQSSIPETTILERRPGVLAYSPMKGHPTVPLSVSLDPRAELSGDVVLGERVSIRSNVSILAPPGSVFLIDDDATIREGVSIDAPPDKVILFRGRALAIYVGRHVHLANQALLYGPCFLGDHCFLGVRATVIDSIVGDRCVIGHAAVVCGVNIPPERFVPHNAVVDSQEKVELLGKVDQRGERLVGEPVGTAEETNAAHNS